VLYTWLADDATEEQQDILDTHVREIRGWMTIVSKGGMFRQSLEALMQATAPGPRYEDINYVLPISRLKRPNQRLIRVAQGIQSKYDEDVAHCRFHMQHCWVLEDQQPQLATNHPYLSKLGFAQRIVNAMLDRTTAEDNNADVFLNQLRDLAPLERQMIALQFVVSYPPDSDALLAEPQLTLSLTGSPGGHASRSNWIPYVADRKAASVRVSGPQKRWQELHQL